MPDDRKSPRLTVEQPDSSAVVDFLPFRTADGATVSGVSIRITYRYNSRTGSGELHICATDDDTSFVLIDQTAETDLVEPDEPDDQADE
jgi:hypothetical protein